MDKSASRDRSLGTPDGGRRSAVRTATVFRPILIEVGDFTGYCLIRNLSPNGMMGEVYTDLPKGSVIRTRLGPDRVLRGKVIWSDEARVGVQFDEDIDVTSVLADITQSPHGQPSRAPRLPMRCAGALLIEGRSHPIELQDISQRGLKARAHFVKEGDEVDIQIDGLERRKAIVRWTGDGVAGLNFIRPLPFKELARWAVWQQGLPAEQCPPSPMEQDAVNRADEKAICGRVG